MKCVLGIVVILAAGISAMPAHKSMQAETECLEEKQVTMQQVLPYVHKYTDPADKENVGDYLLCVWQKKKIIDEEGSVNSKNLARYLFGIYAKVGLTETQKGEVYKESEKCEDLKEENLSTLAVKVKNCMLTAWDNLGYLKPPTKQ
ncbi:hypothetical protein FQR65_LT03171 [Abscondita terminalis]|nr:hypothetical protein FQR65_LT03171 [Abscondita terminalis]